MKDKLENLRKRSIFAGVMKYTLYAPERLRGTVLLPASKSISNRALILHGLSGGNMDEIDNLSDCDDTQVMIRAFREQPGVVDIMAAGTAMRFLTAYLSVTPGERVITGTKRMRQRPIAVLVDALRSLGASIEYVEKEGFPPLRITGKRLKGGVIELPGNVSSQYISALLMVAPMWTEGLIIQLTGEVISRPYIELTIQLMREFGAGVGWNTDTCLQVAPTRYHPVRYSVESDWSAASYCYEMLALSRGDGELFLPRLHADSFQGDCKVAALFEKLGVYTSYEPEGVRLTKTGAVTKCMEYDFVNQPDLAQTFVVTCALLNIPFRFTGLQSLKIKETDRIVALRCEMEKLGYSIGEENDSVLYWNGERCPAHLEDAIATYQDHRMAMAFAPAVLRLPFIQIENPSVVSKSYPAYWKELGKLGFRIEE